MCIYIKQHVYLRTDMYLDEYILIHTECHELSKRSIY